MPTETSPTDKPPPAPHRTAEQDRVPFWQKVAIGMGEISSIGRQSVEQLALPIYNITLGVSPVLVTTVLSLARFLDAFTDPLAGSISDNTHSRFGRRKPYLFLATLVCGVTLPLIWMAPAGWSEMGYFLYFLVTLLVYYVAYSFFNIPLIALALEATPDYHERTRVAAYKSFFVYSMGILSAWLFAITQLKSFDGTLHGARTVGISMGILVIVVGMVPVFLVREGYKKLAVARKGLPFFKGVRETFVNKAFLMLCVIATGNKLSGSLVQSLGLYILIYYVYQGDMKAAAILAGLWGTVYQATTIVTIPLVTWLATHLGKIRALQLCLWTLIVGSISKWFTYQLDTPYMIFATAVLLGPGQTGFYAIIRSIIADICDDDELRTGLRREGMYGSMHAWIEKAMGSLALILTGVVLVVVGFDQGAGGNQAPHAIFYMRLAYVMIPVIGVSVALVVLQYFPLTEARSIEIRRELEKRRGASYAR